MVAVTKIGNPVNTDDFDRSVNKMKRYKNQSKYTIVVLAVSVVLFFFSFFF